MPVDRFASVADFDQAHAEALDLLRQAPVFLLAAPTRDDDGEISVVVMGGGQAFDSFLSEVLAALNMAASPDADELAERIGESIRRSRRVRYIMLATAGANLVLVAWNLTTAVT